MSAKKRADTGKDEGKRQQQRQRGAGGRPAEGETAETEARTVEEAARVAAETTEAEASETEAGGEQVPAEAELAQLRAEIDDLKDQLLRALAETENVRRRAERERQEAMKYAAAPLAKDLLGIADNLRRALDSAPKKEQVQDETLKTLLTGIEMTERELHEVFRRHHIEPIEAQGERFDPHRHEAMFEVPDSTQAAGTVVQELQTGYTLRDRLLRPARVGVAKADQPPERGAGAGDKGGNVDTEA